MSKISELSDGGSLVSSDYLIAVRSGGNVKVRMNQINVDQVDLGDNEFIRLGNSQDLTMVHTSTQSIINQAGIGDLLLQKAGTTKASITANGLEFPDNSKAIFGAGSDLQIYHNGSNSYIQDVGTGKLHITSDGTGVSIDKGVSELMATFDTDGAVTLYHNALAKLATTAAGIDVTGSVTADGLVTQATANTYPASAAQIKSLAGDISYITNVGGDFLISNSPTTDQFVLSSAGNVGIGTSLPSNKLDIKGTVGIEATNSTNKWLAYTYTDNTLRINYNGAGADEVVIDSSGNVGIGVVPTNPLSVYSASGSANINLTRAGTSESLQIGTYYINANGNDLGLATIGSHPMTFKTNNVLAMTLDVSGNLLVGKSVAGTAQGFQVKQDGEVYCTIVNGLNAYHVYANAAYRFYVKPNGGIVNYSSNNINLSDEREKKNVEALPSQWDCLKHWDLKQFHYNADDDALPKKYGVIAQEIEAHCPEVIDVFKVDEDTERMGVKEQQIMWMAVKALQEAQTRIESLEARIAQLES